MDDITQGTGRLMNKSQRELVVIYNSEEEIQSEMFFSDFELLLAGRGTLKSHAASAVKAAYCVIGNGLKLRGVVFFLFNVGEDGRLDADFNLPLQYLVKQAGVGSDLGDGGIRKASRGHCPVPWHSVNLWEPKPRQDEAERGADAAMETLQKRIFRNRLKLKAVLYDGEDTFFDVDDSNLDILTDAEEEGAYSLLQAISDAPSMQSSSPVVDSTDFSAKLTEVFGDAGRLSLQDLIRLHTDQLEQARLKYRQDIDQQQLAYLDQMRTAREEIHSLKVALRQEQSRNRRLQEMLRGDL